MSEDKKVKKVKGKVKAIAKGYFGGKIVYEGEEFEYEGIGKFPLWVKVLKYENEKAEPKKDEPKKDEPKKEESKKSPFSSLV